jgi:hypothetical protein
MPTQPRDVNRWPHQFGAIDRRALMPLLATGAAFLIQTRTALAQQFPIPTTAADVPGPPPGTAMTKDYVRSVGRTAYLWGGGRWSTWLTAVSRSLRVCPETSTGITEFSEHEAD